MRAVVRWLQLDVRRRARSLVALALLLALSGTLVIAVTAGARRDGSAMQRLDAVSLPATAVMLPNTPGFDWGAIKALPEVEAMGEFPVSGSLGIEGIEPDGPRVPQRKRRRLCQRRARCTPRGTPTRQQRRATTPSSARSSWTSTTSASATR